MDHNQALDSCVLSETPWGGVGLAIVLAWSVHAAAAEAPRPNFVFIMSDDHAYQAIGAYGSRLNATPNIDRIANAGVRFDRCYVSNSICAPSRASILTGKYSRANGVLDNYIEFDGDQWTFPKALQRAGYQTAMIGKWHLKSKPTGFDHWDVLRGQGYYYRPKFLSPAGVRQVEGYVTEITTDLAIEWLKGAGTTGRSPDRPFLLMLHHKAPHRPWAPAPKHLRTFEDRHLPEPETLFDDYATRTDAPVDAEMRISQMRLDLDLKVWKPGNRHRDWLYDHMTTAERQAWETIVDQRHSEFSEAALEGRERTRWMWRHYLEDYLACVASVDESVGRVLDWLDNAGLAENTVVIYTSDQGFYLGEHGWFDKRFMYEESLRTPMLVRWPAGVARQDISRDTPRVEQRIVSNLDIAPTLLELAGAERSVNLHGRSMVPLLTGKSMETWRQHFYYHYHEGPERDHAVARHDGVTNGVQKLIHFYELDQWEFYDRSVDASETRNRYGERAYRDTVKHLKAELTSNRHKLNQQVSGRESGP